MSTKNQAGVEAAIHHPLQLLPLVGDALPEVGGSIEVSAGVRWLRMRVPFALDHINLWLLRDEIDSVTGWKIVDRGSWHCK